MFETLSLNVIVKSDEIDYSYLKKNDYFNFEIINLNGEIMATVDLNVFDENLCLR